MGVGMGIGFCSSGGSRLLLSTKKKRLLRSAWRQQDGLGAHYSQFSITTTLLLALVMAPVLCRAQSGPFIPNVQCSPGTLLAGPLGQSGGRTAIVFFQDGVIGAVPEDPPFPGDSTSRIWDISRLPSVQEKTYSGGANGFYDAHGYRYENQALHANGSWRFVNGQPTQANTGSLFFPLDGNNRGRIHVPWSLSAFWPQYGGGSNATGLARRDEVLCRWNTQVGAHPTLLGNIAIFSSDESGQGIVIYDLTPCYESGQAPRQLGIIRNNIAAYWPAIWGGDGKLYAVMADNSDRKMISVVDLGASGNFVAPRVLRAFTAAQVSDGFGNLYPQMQDDNVFLGPSKINLTSLAVTKYIPHVQRNIDVTQFALPIGNLTATGGANFNSGRAGVAIWCHQETPDRAPPKIGFAIPRPGQTRYPRKAPISLLIHETLDSRTIVNGSTFKVSLVSASGSVGQPLAGRLSLSFDDVLTFTPDADLGTDATYEVAIQGIADAVGNRMPATTYRFSTGQTVVGGTTAVSPSTSPTTQPAATCTPTLIQRVATLLQSISAMPQVNFSGTVLPGSQLARALAVAINNALMAKGSLERLGLDQGGRYVGFCAQSSRQNPEAMRLGNDPGQLTKRVNAYLASRVGGGNILRVLRRSSFFKKTY